MIQGTFVKALLTPFTQFTTEPSLRSTSQTGPRDQSSQPAMSGTKHVTLLDEVSVPQGHFIHLSLAEF